MASSFDRRERAWLGAAAVGALVFLVALVSVLAHSGLVALDAPGAEALAHLPLLAARFADIGGGVFVVAPVVILAAAFLLWKRRRWDAARVALLPAAGQIAIDVTKLLVHRARPINPYTSTYSFPSGHATDAAILGCLLVWFAYSARRHWTLVLALVAIAFAWALFVAAMRVTLGVHYVSDVIGGLGLGVAISGFGLAALSRMERRTTT